MSPDFYCSVCDIADHNPHPRLPCGRCRVDVVARIDALWGSPVGSPEREQWRALLDILGREDSECEWDST